MLTSRTTMRSFPLLLALLFATAGSFGASQGPGKGGYKPSELVIRVDSTTSIDALNDLFGTVTHGHQTPTDCYLLFVTGGRNADSLSQIIGQTPGVIYCSPNYYLMAPEGLQQSSAFPDLELIGDIDDQPAADQLQLTEVHTTTTGAGTKVAIIDGGVNLTHPYFSQDSSILISVWDYVDGDSVASDVPGGACSGHGTFVAGIVHLVAPDAELHVYRVLDSAGVGDGYTIAEAVLRAMSDGCQVINLSLGMSGLHDGLDDALKLAKQNDILVIASAGNDSTDVPSEFPFPASRDYCMAIAALDSVLIKADFSNYGEKIAVCAPGTLIYAPYLDDLYAWWSGTSFSAPFVTGLAALLKQQHPIASWDDLYQSITGSALNVDSLNPALAGLLGAGQLNPPAALGVSSSIYRGDVNLDGSVSIGDIASLITYLFIVDDMPNPGIAADVNCDDVITISDISLLVSHLFVDEEPLCSETLPITP